MFFAFNTSLMTINTQLSTHLIIECFFYISVHGTDTRTALSKQSFFYLRVTKRAVKKKLMSCIDPGSSDIPQESVKAAELALAQRLPDAKLLQPS
jgi:hypothetical protein